VSKPTALQKATYRSWLGHPWKPKPEEK
jgi:hypothetical protein